MSGASCAGYGSSAATVLVLYILLVIVLMTFAW
ncbi:MULTISPECIES: YjcZ family sporulation protein [unclassified Paenibacillus]|nr:MULTISPECIES: YjcZ family sporulation protein [unclassified Paenibacillus]